MTADTYSATLGVLIMGTGNDNNTWGGNANSAVFQILEDAIANALSSSVTGGTLDLSGSPPPAAASQARYAALIFSGVLGSNQIIQVPNLTKFWWVKNNTSGAFTLKFQTPAAVLSTAIPQNSGWQLVYCDGANNIVVMPFNSVQVQMPNGSVSLPPYSFLAETNSGLYRAGAGDIRMSILGVDAVKFGAAGILFADGAVGAPSIPFLNETTTGFYRISATTNLGSIASLGSITAGAAYSNGFYANVPLTGGTGTGATADITVGGGVVTLVTGNNPGVGYTAADVLSAAAANIGGTGSGFSVPVATIGGDIGYAVLGVKRLEITAVSFAWAGATYFGSDLSPAAVSASQNNYNPTGLNAATGLRLNVTAACNLTGLAGGAAGREITIANVGTFVLSIPGNSGSSSAANRFAFTANLLPGQSVACRYDATSSLWRQKNAVVAVGLAGISAVSSDLAIDNDGVSPNTKRNITCAEAVLADASGNVIKFETVSVTIDYTTTGAGGCDVGTRQASTPYFEWLISDGVQIKGMASKLSTLAGITLPANYIYARRVGWCVTNGSSNLNTIRTRGRRGQYIVTSGGVTASLPQLGLSAAAVGSPSTPTWVAASVSAFAPATAIAVVVSLAAVALNSIGMAAPNNAYGSINSTTNPPPLSASNASSQVETVQGTLLLESSNVYWAASIAGVVLSLLSFEDNT